MRVFKFRAWYKPGKNWTNLEESYFRECGLNDVIDLYRDDHVLMQFTGLVDKNGKDIYEGDIVEIEMEVKTSKFQLEGEIGKIKHRVNYIVGTFIFACMESIEKPKPLMFYNLDYVEVVGNVFENKDLLEA